MSIFQAKLHGVAARMLTYAAMNPSDQVTSDIKDLELAARAIGDLEEDRTELRRTLVLWREAITALRNWQACRVHLFTWGTLAGVDSWTELAEAEYTLMRHAEAIAAPAPATETPKEGPTP